MSWLTVHGAQTAGYVLSRPAMFQTFGRIRPSPKVGQEEQTFSCFRLSRAAQPVIRRLRAEHRLSRTLKPNGAVRNTLFRGGVELKDAARGQAAAHHA